MSKCQSRRGFQEYPPQLKGALCILGEWAMKEVKDTFKRKRLRVKRGRRHARPPQAQAQRGRRGGVRGERLAQPPAAFYATSLALERANPLLRLLTDGVACAVPSVLSVVVHRPSPSRIVRTYDW